MVPMVVCRKNGFQMNGLIGNGRQNTLWFDWIDDRRFACCIIDNLIDGKDLLDGLATGGFFFVTGNFGFMRNNCTIIPSTYSCPEGRAKSPH